MTIRKVVSDMERQLSRNWCGNPWKQTQRCIDRSDMAQAVKTALKFNTNIFDKQLRNQFSVTLHHTFLICNYSEVLTNLLKTLWKKIRIIILAKFESSS